MSLQRLDLHQAIVEYRRAAKIGERIAARQFVGVFAVAGQFLPPYRQCDHDSGTGAVGDSRAQLETAPIVEYTHVAVGGNIARRRVIGMNVEPGFTLGRAQTLYIDEGTVEKVARGWGNHGQGITLRRRAARVFLGRDKVRQCVHPQGCRAF